MSDILDTIDAATEGRCACGCGVALDPAGPSAWFASQDCQRFWNGRRAERPGDVYRRPDAATAIEAELRGEPFVTRRIRQAEHLRDLLARDGRLPPRVAAGPLSMADVIDLGLAAEHAFDRAGVPPLTRQPEPGPPDVAPGSPYVLLADPEWRDAAHGPVAWRRWCPHCRDFTRPRDGWRLPPMPIGYLRVTDPLPELPDEIPSTGCDTCRRTWPGPRMHAQWREANMGSQVLLRLVAGGGYVVVPLSWDLVDHQDAVDTAWQEAERRMLGALTYSDPCQADGCTETARITYTVNRASPLPFRVRGPARDELKVCPRHDVELRRSVDINWMFRRDA